MLTEARPAVDWTVLGPCTLVQIWLKSVVLFPFHCCVVISVRPISRLITKLGVILPLLLILRVTYWVSRGPASSSYLNPVLLSVRFCLCNHLESWVCSVELNIMSHFYVQLIENSKVNDHTNQLKILPSVWIYINAALCWRGNYTFF